MSNFSDLELAAPILKALERAGYSKPTPIQDQAIPLVRAGNDILGIAQTGTGKTAAFALPILDRLATDRKAPVRKSCRVLVLSPTRELASQIADSFRVYASQLRLSITTVFGGVGHGPQTRALSRGVDVLVATPGRLLDHLSTGTVNLKNTEIFVLDEADQMLDLGFVKPIRDVVSRLPETRQTLMFSATMPDTIARLAKEFLHDPKRISVAPVSSTAERVNQRVIHIEAAEKRSFLTQLIADQNMFRTLVFTRTKRGADRVAKSLDSAGVRVAAIHGNKSQNQRERALELFRKGKIQVLVATDIAARGIDIDDVTHVINFELPEVPEAYVHRIGRTARAGASGSAISFCDLSEVKYLRGIEHLIRRSLPAERHVGEAGGTFALVAMPDRPFNSRRPSSGNGTKRAHKPNAHRAKRPRRAKDNKSADAVAAKPESQRRKPKRKPARRNQSTAERQSAIA